MGPQGPPPDVGCHLGRETQQVVIDEKKAAELVMFDQPQLFTKTALRCCAILGVGRIVFLELLPAEIGQRVRGGVGTAL